MRHKETQWLDESGPVTKETWDYISKRLKHTKYGAHYKEFENTPPLLNISRKKFDELYFGNWDLSEKDAN